MGATTTYRFIGEHAVDHSASSCPARAKALRPSDTCPSSGVRHAVNVGAACVAGNADPFDVSQTGRVISMQGRGERARSKPESAEVLRRAAQAARVSQRDIAAAIGQSATIVQRWYEERATIPADCIWILMRRLPALGARILAWCAAELPEKWRESLPQMVEEAVEDRRRRGLST